MFDDSLGIVGVLASLCSGLGVSAQTHAFSTANSEALQCDCLVFGSFRSETDFLSESPLRANINEENKICCIKA
eukprot:1128582-Amphidinium_carterae.1